MEHLSRFDHQSLGWIATYHQSSLISHHRRRKPECFRRSRDLQCCDSYPDYSTRIPDTQCSRKELGHFFWCCVHMVLIYYAKWNDSSPFCAAKSHLYPSALQKKDGALVHRPKYNPEILYYPRNLFEVECHGAHHPNCLDRGLQKMLVRSWYKHKTFHSSTKWAGVTNLDKIWYRQKLFKLSHSWCTQDISQLD